MKHILKLKHVLLSLLVLSTMTGCFFSSASGPVPEDWYILPENGTAKNPGDKQKFGQTIEEVFNAHTSGLEQVAETPATGAAPLPLPNSDLPVDYVPWHLAILSSDFGLTLSGVWGAFLGGQGSANVQANWVLRNPTGLPAPLATAVSEQRPTTKPAHLMDQQKISGKMAHLLIRGTASKEDVEKQMEPSIQAALASSNIKDEGKFRNAVLTAAENFRSMAINLNNINENASTATPEEQMFLASAFRLEITIDENSQITPKFGFGGAINLRFDWIINGVGTVKPKPSILDQTVPNTNVAGQNLARFVRSVTPDVIAAVSASDSVKKSGFALSSIRVGLTMAGDWTIGISDVGAEIIGSVVFGDNDEEGGCYDPDGDGDCEAQPGQTPHPSQPNQPRTVQLTSLIAPHIPELAEVDDGIKLIKHSVTPEHLNYAMINNIHYWPSPEQNQDQQKKDNHAFVFTVPHAKFRAGLIKAISMASFFAEHAATADKQSKWKLKELEAEFDLSVTGTTGMRTLSGGGELEIEFENQEK